MEHENGVSVEIVDRMAEACKRGFSLSYGTGRLKHDFDLLVDAVGPAKAVGALAAACWDEDVLLLEGVSGARALDAKNGVPTAQRVAIFYHGLGTGGAEAVTLSLARLWHDMGKEVLILCDRGRRADVESRPGMEVRELPSCFECDRERYAQRAVALRDVLEDFRPGCLVYGAWLSSTIVWDLLVSRLCGVPFVVHTHGSHRVLCGYGDPRALRIPAVYRHVDGVIALSKEDCTFWSAFNPRTYRVVNQVDGRFLELEPCDLGGHTLLWVGRIASDKSPLEAVDVLSRVRASVPDVRLVMAGPIEDVSKEAIEARAAELGMADAVSLAGNVDHEDMPAMLRTGDLLLFTSHFEGYPVALAEAKASGLPAILYDLSWLTLLEDYRGVRVAPVGDVEGLARQAVDVLSDGDLRRRLGREAREHMQELASFDLESFWDRVFAEVAEPVGSTRESAGPSAASLLAELLLEAGDVEMASQQRLHAVEAERNALGHDLACVTGSVSFKVGRLLTAPLRMIRNATHAS